MLRRELGEGHWIVEEGLNGRTTVWDDPLEPHRNGRELLLPILLTHQPLDLVIVMLGTNDLKHRMNASAAEIAEGAGMLVDIVAASGCGPDGRAPQTLLVCPAPIARLDLLRRRRSREGRRSPAGWQSTSRRLPRRARARSSTRER